jgi:CcmD family protein
MNDNLPYLFAAYTVIWLAFFAYLFFVSRRQRELERELRAVQKALEEGRRRPSNGT